MPIAGSDLLKTAAWWVPALGSPRKAAHPRQQCGVINQLPGAGGSMHDSPGGHSLSAHMHPQDSADPRGGEGCLFDHCRLHEPKARASGVTWPSLTSLWVLSHFPTRNRFIYLGWGRPRLGAKALCPAHTTEWAYDFQLRADRKTAVPFRGAPCRLQAPRITRGLAEKYNVSVPLALAQRVGWSRGFELGKLTGCSENTASLGRTSYAVPGRSTGAWPPFPLLRQLDALRLKAAQYSGAEVDPPARGCDRRGCAFYHSDECTKIFPVGSGTFGSRWY